MAVVLERITDSFQTWEGGRCNWHFLIICPMSFVKQPFSLSHSESHLADYQGPSTTNPKSRKKKTDYQVPSTTNPKSRKLLGLIKWHNYSNSNQCARRNVRSMSYRMSHISFLAMEKAWYNKNGHKMHMEKATQQDVHMAFFGPYHYGRDQLWTSW